MVVASIIRFLLVLEVTEHQAATTTISTFRLEKVTMMEDWAARMNVVCI